MNNPRHHRHSAFTLLEIIVVVTLMMVLLGVSVVVVTSNQDNVLIKDDGARMIAYLRNAWDHTRATGAPLVLRPNYEKGSLTYYDPLSGQTKKAELAGDHRIIGIRINDRMYSATTGGMNPGDVEAEEDEELESVASMEDEFALYLSEGRGMARISVIFAAEDEDQEGYDQYRHIVMASLNLITGKGAVKDLEREDLDQLFEISLEAELDEELL